MRHSRASRKSTSILLAIRSRSATVVTSWHPRALVKRCVRRWSPSRCASCSIGSAARSDAARAKVQSPAQVRFHSIHESHSCDAAVPTGRVAFSFTLRQAQCEREGSCASLASGGIDPMRAKPELTSLYASPLVSPSDSGYSDAESTIASYASAIVAHTSRFQVRTEQGQPP